MLVWSPNHCVSDAKREWGGTLGSCIPLGAGGLVLPKEQRRLTRLDAGQPGPQGLVLGRAERGHHGRGSSGR